MLGVFSDGTEVIICEINQEGRALTSGYFSGKDERNREDYNFALVDAPIRVERGFVAIEAERTLKGLL